MTTVYWFQWWCQKWWWWWWRLYEVHIDFNESIKNRDGFNNDDDDGDDDVGSNDDKMIMTRRSNDCDNENKNLWYL